MVFLSAPAHMELLSAYPALVVGAFAGYLAARLGWRLMPLLAVGAVVLAVLAVYESTVPAHATESGPITAPLWMIVAAVNAASWAGGIGIGVAIDSTSRRGTRVRTGR
jgi:MFS-type transporter involved in bile tolerance (Atg22 family)